jgi:hypothetical protein
MRATDLKTPPPLLIVVHPGSACGSADFNIGQTLAQAAREALTRELEGWKGHILVVDGELSEELPDYRFYNRALESAIDDADDNGFKARRIYACAMNTPNWPARVSKAVSKLPKSTRIGITGAWFHHMDNDGCVNHVHAVISQLGFARVDVLDSAVSIDDGDEDEEYEN